MAFLEKNIINDFLPKPQLRQEELYYIKAIGEVYINLFEIKFNKMLRIYQYPFEVIPEIEPNDLRIREKIFKASIPKLKKIFGECFMSGDYLFNLRKAELNMPIIVKCLIKLDNVTKYNIIFKFSNKNRVVMEEEAKKDKLTKKFIELILGDILCSSSKVKYMKGLFVLKDQIKAIENLKVSYNSYPYFTYKFVDTEKGNFINVNFKRRFFTTQSILKILKSKNYSDKRNHRKIKDLLIGKSFTVFFIEKNLKIKDIFFDRNPKNQSVNYEGKTITLAKYYEEVHKLRVIDFNQPIILAQGFNSIRKLRNLYFVPEFCFLAGFNDDATKDKNIMRLLINYTRLSPNDRMKKTKEFFKIITDSKESNDQYKISAKKKLALYGIDIKPLENSFSAYYMKKTILIAGNNKEIKPTKKIFPLFRRKNMTNWICFYEKSNYKEAKKLGYILFKASKRYCIKIKEPKWVELPDNSKVTKWINEAEYFFGNNKKDYSFGLFLLGEQKRNNIYKDLKKNSLCKNGFISQFVKTKSLQKNIYSVCSKILLQINAKLQGVSYKLKMDMKTKEKRIMIIGISPSYIMGKKSAVGMVATINNFFTVFYNETYMFQKTVFNDLEYCVSSFVGKAIDVYKKKNGRKPKNIIIYRKGVPLWQKDLLKDEIGRIDYLCKNKNINYCYIIVNHKKYKFFEKVGMEYNNPSNNILLLDEIAEKNFFEFYISPQNITGGTSIPTCFHVAQGNMDSFELIPKLTYDLCHIYSNNQGPIKIPGIIRASNKLAKMTAKYTSEELHSSLKIGQAYL